MSSSIDHGAELDAGEQLRAGGRLEDEPYCVKITRGLLSSALIQLDNGKYLDALSCLANANYNLLVALQEELEEAKWRESHSSR
jgi:hypothetical protein